MLPEHFSEKSRRHSQITESRAFHAKSRKSPLFWSKIAEKSRKSRAQNRGVRDKSRVLATLYHLTLESYKYNIKISKIMDFLFYFHFYCTKTKQNLSKANCLNNKSFPEIDQSERRIKHGGKNLNPFGYIFLKLKLADSSFPI